MLYSSKNEAYIDMDKSQNIYQKKKKESYKTIRKMYTVECDLYKVKTHKRTLDIV